MLNMKATTSKSKYPFAPTSCWVAAHSQGNWMPHLHIYSCFLESPEKHGGKVTELLSDMHKGILTVLVRDAAQSMECSPNMCEVPHELSMVHV